MASAKAAKTDEPWTVSALADRIDAALKQGLPKTVRVRGEISGFRDRTHWYFDLKDADAVVGVTMFASAAKRSRVTPANGQEFIVTGRVEFWAAGGKTSIIATSIAPVGLGALEEKYRALVEELRGLGWFAEERKRALPNFPRRIAIITSRTGAALQDVLDTARRRLPAVELVLVDARVQGAEAAGEIAHAIAALGRSHERLGIDAILVTRGGGSMEDLWAFNERIVAEAIVRCPIPVVAAIGHETDTTIAELVADLRCSTPTQAAMRLIPDRAALEAQLESMTRRLRSDVRKQLESVRRLIRSHERRPSLASPDAILSRERGVLDRVAERLAIARRHTLERARARLSQNAAALARMSPRAVQAQRRLAVDTASRRLQEAVHRRIARSRSHFGEVYRHLGAISPLTILERGYSITTDDRGRVLRDAASLSRGDSLTTRLAKGTVRSTVSGDAPAPDPVQIPKPTRASRPAPPRSNEPPQMDLFGPTE